MNLNSLIISALTILGVGTVSMQAWTIYELKSQSRVSKSSKKVFSSLGAKTWHDPKNNVTLSKGPWGILERVPLKIAPPLEFAAAMDLDQSPNKWFFPDFSPEQLQEFISALDLSLEMKNQILAASAFNENIKGFETDVNEDIRKNLTSEARRKIYNVLSTSHLNHFQENAYRYSSEHVDSIFAYDGLSPEIADVIRKYSYKNGGFTFFSDAPLLREFFGEGQNRAKIFRALSTQSTFMIKVKIPRDADFGSFLAYWGKGGRAKDIGPFVQSLRDNADEPSLDLVHFLPGFARRRLYTFPRPDETGLSAPRDCHWTAFNFFNDMPSDEFSDPQRVIAAINEDYVPIFGNYGFGDLVLFSDESSTIFHSAIMIADDILYTKNGSSSASPWMLVTLKDMKDFYQRRSKVTVSFYRKKDFY